MKLEEIGIVGNCQFSALIANTGDVVWCCLPRFDSDPVFASLLDEKEGGHFSVAPESGGKGTQRYLDNTNVLETRFDGPAGSFRVLDFAPRFLQYDRAFRPTQLFRIIEPISGAPRVRVSCAPRQGWSRKAPPSVSGSNHIRFEGFASPVRITTDVPLSYLSIGQPFTLTERMHVVFTWGAPIEEPLRPLADRFLEETVSYWQGWVKHCNIPPFYQDEVIRSALVLKLHCFQDTGAIIAATTTSIPESMGTTRTWDYRYCWLRDAYYALEAFRMLGHFEEREAFLRFLLDVAGGSKDLSLAPLYRVDGRSDLEEWTAEGWPGFEGNGPVRIGNAAALHQQHDIFGEMVLALAPLFLDDRFRPGQSPAALDLVERLARKGIAVAGTPDASIWEHRTSSIQRTFSTLMCWAGADRMALIARQKRPEHVDEFTAAAHRLRTEMETHAFDAATGSFVAGYGTREFDASLLQMATLRFLSPGDPRLRSTIDTVRTNLEDGGWLRRYRTDDGFGTPSVAFVICTFWLVEALARTGRAEEARALFETALKASSPLGLLSEDYDPLNRRLLGNFPQAYSHVGLIRAAFAASPSWQEIA